jgi:hypothetical protein
MATTLTMELTTEQVDALSTEPSFRDALNRWISEVGTPITWNFWQKGFAMIRARYEGRDAEASPGSAAFSTWCWSLWYELSEGVYGLEWRKLLRMGRVTPALPQSGRLRVAQLAGALGATTQRGLRPTAKAAVRPTPTSLQSKFGRLLPQGADAMGGLDTRLRPEGVASAFRGPPPAGFSVSVPTTAATRASTELRVAAMPGDFPDAQFEVGCVISS